MRGFLVLAAALLLPWHAATAETPVFDMHVHLWKGAESVEAYEAQLKASSVEVAGFAAMWFGGPNQAREGKVPETRANNDRLIALARSNPKILPVATVHPYDGEAALEEIDRLSALGVKVLKIHPHTQQFDAADPRVLQLARRAGDRGIVVLMDNANILPGDNEKLFNLALQAPKTKFVFAHIGGLNFRFWNILALARTADDFFMDNIYFDISGTVLLAADAPIEEEFVWTLRNVGIDNVLLGSDYPQITLGKTVDALERLDLTAEEKSKIRSGNARKLFGR